MPNRYTRDQIIRIALNRVNLPNLTVHDMPGEVVQPDALCIDWLQEIMDFWHHMVPFSATVKSIQLNAAANIDYIVLPIDFILDVRNGYVTETVPGDKLSLGRRIRVPLQKFLNRKFAYQRSSNVFYPIFYCVQDGDTDNTHQYMQITPTPNISTVGKLWYYALPPVLQAGDKPNLPNDYIATEYIYIRAMEWAQLAEFGTARKFCDKILAGYKAAGLLNEPEDDEIPFDGIAYKHGGYGMVSPYSWMGSV